jgi:hypothetical protein
LRPGLRERKEGIARSVRRRRERPAAGRWVDSPSSSGFLRRRRPCVDGPTRPAHGGRARVTPPPRPACVAAAARAAGQNRPSVLETSPTTGVPVSCGNFLRRLVCESGQAPASAQLRDAATERSAKRSPSHGKAMRRAGWAKRPAAADRWQLEDPLGTG